jgi:small subunit ribosomal protein S4
LESQNVKRPQQQHRAEGHKMGRPKFARKQYETPKHPWKEDRIKSERELMKKYGLKNHKEVWKAKTHLSKFRGQARELLGKTQGANPQMKKESEQLLLFLTKIGILPMGSSLDDVLALETETILSRRLQTLVYLKGLGSTIDHSRQLINHGHIAVSGRKITIPGYMVKKDEERTIIYTDKSTLNTLSHPARPKTEVAKITSIPIERTEIPKPAIEPKQPEPTPPAPEAQPEKPIETPQPTKEPSAPAQPIETPIKHADKKPVHTEKEHHEKKEKPKKVEELKTKGAE